MTFIFKEKIRLALVFYRRRFSCLTFNIANKIFLEQLENSNLSIYLMALNKSLNWKRPSFFFNLNTNLSVFDIIHFLDPNFSILRLIIYLHSLISTLSLSYFIHKFCQLCLELSINGYFIKKLWNISLDGYIFVFFKFWHSTSSWSAYQFIIHFQSIEISFFILQRGGIFCLVAQPRKILPSFPLLAIIIHIWESWKNILINDPTSKFHFSLLIRSLIVKYFMDLNDFANYL